MSEPDSDPISRRQLFRGAADRLLRAIEDVAPHVVPALGDPSLIDTERQDAAVREILGYLSGPTPEED